MEEYYMVKKEFDDIPVGTLVRKLDTNDEYLTCEIMFVDTIREISPELTHLHNCGGSLSSSSGYNIWLGNLRKIAPHPLLGSTHILKGNIIGITFNDETDSKQPLYGAYLKGSSADIGQAAFAPGFSPLIGTKKGLNGDWLLEEELELITSKVEGTIKKEEFSKEVKIIRREIKLW